MDQDKMVALMTNSCLVLNKILRDPDKYKELKAKYQKLERDGKMKKLVDLHNLCLLYTSPSPRDATLSRMPSSA